MGQGVRGGTGKLLSAAKFVVEYTDAVNADLMRIGHRVRDLEDPESSGLTLIDVYALIVTADRNSAMCRTVHPRDSQWDTSSMLLASMLEHMLEKTWVEGGKKGKRPERIPRPGVEDKKAAVERRTTDKPVSIEELDAWMASRQA